MLCVACHHRGGRNGVEPEPGADTLQIAPDTALIVEEAPVEEILDELGNISTEPVVAVIPASRGNEPVRIEETVEFDKILHDFGDFTVKDGPRTCTFTVKNIGKDPLAIYEVITSCGCTDATWTREPLTSGKSGKITVTYKNEDGPYPFDKTLTVWLSALKKPVILRIRGAVHEKKQTLEQYYGAVRAGDLGLKEAMLGNLNLEQGQQKSDQVYVANLSRKSIRVDFKEVSKGLTLEVTPNPVPARSTATLSYTLSSDPEKWGKNLYTAVPVVDGKAYPSAVLTVRGVTKQNFDSWTEEDKEKASLPLLDESTLSFGTVKAGEPVTASYTITNKGKGPFICYKADTETPGVRFSTLPEIAPGDKATLTVTVDTSVLPAGNNDIYMTLTTNAPSRPFITLFLFGKIEAE